MKKGKKTTKKNKIQVKTNVKAGYYLAIGFPLSLSLDVGTEKSNA